MFIKNAIAQQVNQLVTKTEELQKQLEAQPYAKVDFGGTKIAEDRMKLSIYQQRPWERLPKADQGSTTGPTSVVGKAKIVL